MFRLCEFDMISPLVFRSPGLSVLYCMRLTLYLGDYVKEAVNCHGV